MRESHDYRDVIVFEKLVVFVHAKPDRIFKFSGLGNVFEKLRFCAGLEWTVDLSVDITLCIRFQMSPV